MSGRGKNLNVWIERALVRSKAFADMRTATAHRVLMIFFTKRQVAKVRQSGRECSYMITNNGEIVFTYQEARKKYGIGESAFRNAIDELIEKGFIDIAESGAGLYRAANLYSISNRWREYGTPEFKPARPRPRGPINRGFRKGNQHGRNCTKTESTVGG